MLFTSFAVGTPLSFSSSLKQKNKIHIEIRKSIFFLSTKYMNAWYGSRDVRHRHHRHHQVHLPLPLQLINRSTININIDDYRLYYYEPALTETTATGCCWCCWCAACWAVNVACFYINRSLAIKTKKKKLKSSFFFTAAGCETALLFIVPGCCCCCCGAAEDWVRCGALK